jgi:hypothetical protein
MVAMSQKDIKITVQKFPPPLPLAWACLPDGGDQVTRLHKVHYRAIWRSRNLLGALEMMALFLLWPFLLFPRIRQATRRNGAMIQQRTGKSRLRQMWEQLVLAARFGIRPDFYYKMEFFLPERARLAGGYVHRYATKDSLYRLLKPDGVGLSPLTDKVGFARYCAERNLKVAPIIAALQDGRIVGPFNGLPPMDLFVKRTRGRGGSGAELWTYADGRYHTREGLDLDADALIARVTELSKREPYLVQERLVNDPALRDLCQGALATVRMVSAINERGEPEAIRAVFRMPSRAESIVDNYHAGGIAAAIDLATGELGSATDMGLAPSLGWVDVHPISGAQIKGRILPRWPEMLALVLRAHGQFADRAIIGWDVALTDQGIVIVEGNAASDTDIIQRCHRAPLSQSRYPELMNWHLQRLGRM